MSSLTCWTLPCKEIWQCFSTKMCWRSRMDKEHSCLSLSLSLAISLFDIKTIAETTTGDHLCNSWQIAFMTGKHNLRGKKARLLYFLVLSTSQEQPTANLMKPTLLFRETKIVKNVYHIKFITLDIVSSNNRLVYTDCWVLYLSCH